MHGLGNDFVVFDAINQAVTLSRAQIQWLANRRFGIGCDQLLLVEASDNPEADFRYRIFNADGGEVEQCGNGARCFARFVRDHGLTDKSDIVVETASGIITLRIEDNGQVRVDMGRPRFDPAALPFDQVEEQSRYAISVGQDQVSLGAVSMGNPHAVLQVDDIEQAEVARLGPLLEQHPLFPQRVNVGFMQVIDRAHIRLRVYERGAAETLACGTGACAAMVIGRCWGLLDEEVAVDLPGGRLNITWAGGDAPVIMTGPADHVFEGSIEL